MIEFRIQRAKLAIYTPYVLTTAIRFETLFPTSYNKLATRLAKHIDVLPWLVAETVASGEIIGYAYANPYGAHAAFAWSAENSVYISQNLRCCVSVGGYTKPWQAAPNTKLLPSICFDC